MEQKPDPIPMKTPDPLYTPMHAALKAAQDLLYAAAKSYREELPEDAKAWGAMLLAGKVVPALTIEFPPEGARISCGYVEANGTFHRFFEVPDPRLAPAQVAH